MSHHHHHCCHGEGECCCHHDHHHDSCCHESSCCESDEHPQDFAGELLELADAAWMELLKDKIKEQIEASSGKHLDQLAKLVTSSNKVRWENKMASKRVSSEFREKLCDYFHKK